MRNTKALIIGATLAASLAAFAGGADAAPVQKCYKLDPFIDILKLTRGDSVFGHRLLYGSWIASGIYTLPVSGSNELEAGSTTVRKIGIVGTNNTAGFGDNLICGLTGIPGGSWELNCSGGSSNVNFQRTGTLTAISCSGLPPSSARAGRAAGAK